MSTMQHTENMFVKYDDILDLYINGHYFQYYYY